MTDMTEPISTRNLDRYGSAELPWSRPRDILASDTPQADLTFFLAWSTVRFKPAPSQSGWLAAQEVASPARTQLTANG